jgi:orotidine-5'-phosphate decarboxylase
MSIDIGMTLPAIFCSIDTTDIDRALALSAAMSRAGCGIKIGLEFFSAQGPQGVRQVRNSYPDLPLFIDLKYHDIPNTVAGAVRAIATLEPDFINVHTLGGSEMMQLAADMIRSETEGRTKILGVTILTSHDENSLAETGIGGSIENRVVTLAKLAQESGLDGIVCSPHEILPVRKNCGADFVLMTPGIRPEGSAANDQKRFMTPREAIDTGATHLVIGRPITGAADPAAAAKDILKSLAA